MCANNETRSLKLRLNSVCVKNWLLLNFKLLFPKNGFCVKPAQRMQLAIENCILLLLKLNTGFIQILSLSTLRIRFASSLHKECESLLKMFYDSLCWKLVFAKY